MVSADREHARPASVPRQGHDCARVARRPASGIGGHHRPSGASRLPGSAGDAARSGLCAGPHVHVGLRHVRVDSAPGRDDRAPRVDSHRARPPRGLRDSDGAHLDVASRRRAQGTRRRRAGEPAGAAPLHAGHHGAAWKRGPRDANRRAVEEGAAGGLAARLWPDRTREVGVGVLAHARVGGLRAGLRRLDRLRRRHRRAGRECPARPGRRIGSRLSAPPSAGGISAFWMDVKAPRLARTTPRRSRRQSSMRPPRSAGASSSITCRLRTLARPKQCWTISR